MRTAILASQNKNKIREIRDILERNEVSVELLCPADFDQHEEPDENGSSFKENAYIKAETVYAFAEGFPVLADDSGLIIDYLSHYESGTVEDAMTTLDEVMPAWANICPAGGTAAFQAELRLERPTGSFSRRFAPRSCRSIPAIPTKKTPQGVFFVELAGIEPASKDPSIPVSSITVFVLTFPLPHVQRQT